MRKIKFPIDRVLNQALESDAVLGGKAGGDEFLAQCSDKPIGHRLRRVFEQLGKPIPDACSLYEGFDVWLIPHRVSILRRKGHAEPVSVGISIEYDHGEQTCSIISLIPEYQFISRGHIGAEIGFKGLMSATGEAGSTEDAAKFDAHKVGGALQFGLNARGEVGFQISASVCSPIIAAVGKGSSCCEWVFHRQDVPLHDRDLETWSVVALSKWWHPPELVYRLKLYYTTRTLFFPTRRESDAVAIKCRLAP